MTNEQPSLITRSILKHHRHEVAAQTDQLAVEEPLDIRLSNGGPARSVAITMRTPGRDADLARGFLFTEGVFGARTRATVPDTFGVQCAISPHSGPRPGPQRGGSNVVTVTLPPTEAIDWNRLDRHSYTSSSCGVCGKTSLDQVYQTIPFGDSPNTFTVTPEVLYALPDKLGSTQVLFAQTGGIHAVGLFTPQGELLHFAEDVGRHNALDKLIGHYHAQQSLPLDAHVLLLSGRASFELIQKAGMAGVGVVAAVGAPSSLAVQLAEELSITLIGFLREGRFNCYCGEERIGR